MQLRRARVLSSEGKSVHNRAIPGCLRDEISQCLPEILEQSRISVRDRDSGRATLPDSHQPPSSKAKSGDRVPLEAGTEPRSTGFRTFLLSSESHTQMLISYTVG